MTIRGSWVAFWDTFAASLDLWTAEKRAGISLIEAVEADAFETDLRMVTGDEEGRKDLRALAILAGQCGLRAEDIEPMARHYFTTYRVPRP